jgi:hypothetical protein
MARASMQALRGTRELARLIVLSYLAAACSTWRLQPEPRAALASPRASVRVALVDGSRLVLRDAQVRTDSLFARTESDDSLRVAIPLSTVRSIEVLEPNTGRVILMTGGVLVALSILTVLVGLIAFASSHQD